MLSDLIAAIFIIGVTLFMCVVIFAPILGGIAFIIRNIITLFIQLNPVFTKFSKDIKKELKKRENKNESRI